MRHITIELKIDVQDATEVSLQLIQRVVYDCLYDSQASVFANKIDECYARED